MRGFENNQEMVRDYCSQLTATAYPLGTPYNTGDGIKMAMASGADLWHMSCIAGPVYCSLKVPEFRPSWKYRRWNRIPGSVPRRCDCGRGGREAVRPMKNTGLPTVNRLINGRWAQTPTPDAAAHDIRTRPFSMWGYTTGTAITAGTRC